MQISQVIINTRDKVDGAYGKWMSLTFCSNWLGKASLITEYLSKDLRNGECMLCGNLEEESSLKQIQRSRVGSVPDIFHNEQKVSRERERK